MTVAAVGQATSMRRFRRAMGNTMQSPFDTRGRSRVLGVLQLVALVVLLSGVLGIGIHGAVGELAETMPAAEFDFEYDEATETLVVTHDGGEPVAASEVRLAGVDADCDVDAWGSDVVSSGDTCTVSGVPTDAHVRMAWDGVGQNAATFAGWAGPDA